MSLVIGDKLLVQLDDDEGAWSKWTEATVTGLSIAHVHKPKDGKLHPYIIVGLECEDEYGPTSINYSMYCAEDAVRFLEND